MTKCNVNVNVMVLSSCVFMWRSGTVAWHGGGGVCEGVCAFVWSVCVYVCVCCDVCELGLHKGQLQVKAECFLVPIFLRS